MGDKTEKKENNYLPLRPCWVVISFDDQKVNKEVSI